MCTTGDLSIAKDNTAAADGLAVVVGLVEEPRVHENAASLEEAWKAVAQAVALGLPHVTGDVGYKIDCVPGKGMGVYSKNPNSRGGAL